MSENEHVREPGSWAALWRAARAGVYPGYTEWTAAQVESSESEDEDARCDVWEPEDGPLAGPPNTQCLLKAGHPGGHLFDPERDR
jgi:hypothetical protein